MIYTTEVARPNTHRQSHPKLFFFYLSLALFEKKIFFVVYLLSVNMIILLLSLLDIVVKTEIILEGW
jgi:hypothetical protein